MLFIVIFTVIFVLISYAVYSIVDALWLQRSRIRRRAENLADGTAGQHLESQQVESEEFPLIARMLSSKNLADKIFLMLLRAGVKLRPSEFIGIVAACAIILALIATWLSNSVLAVIGSLVLGVLGPYIYIKLMQARRVAFFNRQLPDALSLIGSAIRSGYSFQRAIQMVSDEMPAPISEEFQRVLNECSVGFGTDVALSRMVTRIQSYDLELVATAVIIQQQIGGNLAEIIDNIGETIRDRIRVEHELAALTADGRLSGVILSALPIFLALMILCFNPGYLRPLISEPIGRLIVVAAISMQIIGVIVIKKMLVLDY